MRAPTKTQIIEALIFLLGSASDLHGMLRDLPWL